ncbi:ATP-binding protein [Azotosporobacter soli]|uniref:ATP-binding protein n=1 Tax=Azotosporobacter soli TaxID=3055040 RepID=UPI0031FEBDDC
MDNIHASVLSSLLGTVSIILIYFYLYALYRKRYLGIWAISWLVLLSRFALFDSGLIAWQQNLFYLTIYQIQLLMSGLLYAWGTHLFLSKKLDHSWIYVALSIFIVSIGVNLLQVSLLYKLLLPFVFADFICIWIGMNFLRCVELQGIGHLITGYAFIIWGLVSLAMPFVIDDPLFIQITYTLGGLLRFIIGVGTLVVYFEKNRAELVIKQNEFRLLAENAVDVIYHYQLFPVQKLKYISPSVLTITGYPPEAYYLDKSIVFQLIHPDDVSLLANFIKNMLLSVETPLTLRLLTKDEITVWVEQKCLPIYDAKGELIALEGIIRDITERKRLEQLTLNVVGSMAVTVAHEIRNPMTTVRGYLQVLEKKDKYQEDKQKFSLMIEEIDRANAIIQEYLSLSQEKAARLEPCSLNHIVKTLFPLIQVNSINAKTTVSLDLATIPDLFLDKNEMRQLLLNIVRNGIEAMSSGGNLLIRTYQEDNKTVLAISDQGDGIPPQVLERLGTPFTTTKDSGTGLGIPICYQIAQRHNAKIVVDTSKAGTTFKLYFNSQAS